MPLRDTVIKGGPNNTAAFVTGQQELLVRLNSVAATAGLATETTLQSILTTLQAFTEYEAKFVLDANNEIFLEVRVWNEDTGTWAGTPTYYRPGQTTPASPAPVAPIIYADSTPILTTISSAVSPLTSVTPNIIIATATGPTAIAVPVYSVTFFNNGSVNTRVSFNSGSTYSIIPAGTSITMDAGGIKNTYAANKFYYDTLTADPAGSMIVTYNS